MPHDISNHLAPPKHPFIFIVGVPRSGTTLLSAMLNKHSKLAIPYESNFMVDCYKRHGLNPKFTDESDLKSLINEILSGPVVSKWNPNVQLEDIDLNKCQGLQGIINEIYRCYAHKKGKVIWGDKTPNYTTSINVLNRIFPNAKYVHLIRDGRDVALSLIEKPWGPSVFRIALRLWRDMVLSANNQLSMLPEDRYIELRFEDLVSNPERSLRKICHMININFEEGMIANYSDEWSGLPMEVKGIHKNLKKGPSQDHCFKWKSRLDGPEQAIAYEIAGDTLDHHGYDVSVKNHKFKIIKKIYLHLAESIKWRMNNLRR